VVGRVQVNSSGVMPIIFSSSLLAAPASLARFSSSSAFQAAATSLYPGGVCCTPVPPARYTLPTPLPPSKPWPSRPSPGAPSPPTHPHVSPAPSWPLVLPVPGALYLPLSVGLIAFFNYFYTFLQLDPDDLSDQLKRQGASIPSVRPGKATSTFITKVGPPLRGPYPPPSTRRCLPHTPSSKRPAQRGRAPAPTCHKVAPSGSPLVVAAPLWVPLAPSVPCTAENGARLCDCDGCRCWAGSRFWGRPSWA